MKSNHLPRLFAIALAIALVFVCALAFDVIDIPTSIGLTALGAVGFLMKDGLLKKTAALPAAAGSTSTAGIDLEEGTRGDFLANCEFLLTAPALTTTQLPDTKTMTYKLEHDTDSAFGTATTIAASVITQTGAGGAGAAGSTFRFRAATTVKRYVRATATGGAAIGDCSAASMTLELLS
jgi:hypothetical protein